MTLNKAKSTCTIGSSKTWGISNGAYPPMRGVCMHHSMPLCRLVQALVQWCKHYTTSLCVSSDIDSQVWKYLNSSVSIQSDIGGKQLWQQN